MQAAVDGQSYRAAMADGLRARGARPAHVAAALARPRAAPVARAVGRAAGRVAQLAAPALEARAARPRAAPMAVAPEAGAADRVEWVSMQELDAAVAPAPALEARARARRLARAVTRAAVLALRLRAVVSAPALVARALARRRARAAPRAVGRAQRRGARRSAPAGKARAHARCAALPMAGAVVRARGPAAVDAGPAVGAPADARRCALASLVGLAALVAAAVWFEAALPSPARHALALVGGDTGAMRAAAARGACNSRAIRARESGLAAARVRRDALAAVVAAAGAREARAIGPLPAHVAFTPSRSDAHALALRLMAAAQSGTRRLRAVGTSPPRAAAAAPQA